MRKKWKPVLAAVLLAAMLAAVWFAGDKAGDSYDGQMYDERLILYEGWKTVTAVGEKSVRLPKYVHPDRDGTVTLVHVLPRIVHEGTFLAVYSGNASVSASIGGETVYVSQQDGDSEPLPKWNYIHIEPAQAGREVRLVFSGTDSFDTGMLSEILLGTYGELMMYATARESYDRWLNLSILFIGFLVILFSLATFSSRRESTGYLLLGILILMLGLCGISRAAATDIPTRGYRTMLILGRLIYGMIPAVYCLYRGHGYEGKAKKRFDLLAWVSFLFTTAGMLLWLLGPKALRPALRHAANAEFCLVGLYCLHDIVRNGKKERLRGRALLFAGLSALLLGHTVGAFTHLGDTAIRIARPETIGALVFALLQTVVGLFSAYSHLERQMAMERELSEGKIKLMINQIKPHFINNVMTTIRSMIQYDPDAADEMVYKFNKYLVYNIDALGGTELCPFAMELKHIETYLTIELTHLRPRLRVKYDVQADDFDIPPLSIQPFVENAVKHGIAPKMEACTLQIASGEAEDHYFIRIADDGVGFDTSKPYDLRGGHGLGLNNAIQRLKLLVNGAVQIESEPGKGTVVTVTIPKLREEDFDEDDIG